MGLPLRQIPLASFFEQWFLVQTTSEEFVFYYKDVYEILTHPFISLLFKNSTDSLTSVFNTMKDQNRTAVSLRDLILLAPTHNRP